MLRRGWLLVLLVIVAGACDDRLVAPAAPTAIALRIYPTGPFAFNVGEPFLFTATLIAADSTELGPAASTR